jgi:hypothetical protein
MAYRARAPRSRSANSSRRSHDRPGSPGEPDTGRSRTGVIGPFRTVTVREMRVAGLSQRPTTVGGFDTGKLLAVKVARAVWEGAVGKGPDQLAPRWRPTSPHAGCGRGPAGDDQWQHWHRTHRSTSPRRPSGPGRGVRRGCGGSPSSDSPWPGAGPANGPSVRCAAVPDVSVGTRWHGRRRSRSRCHRRIVSGRTSRRSLCNV